MATITHQNTEQVSSWLLDGNAASLARACTDAMNAVRADGGDPATVRILIADMTDEPNLATLHKRTLTDDSNVYDLEIQ